MNVDNELDQHLLKQFSCLSTTEKGDLVKQLQDLLAGCNLSEATATFFLDMNNWNLQAAICSYIDYSNSELLSMKILNECTSGGNEAVLPNTPVRKSWRIKNSGQDAWPSGTGLQFVKGWQLSDCRFVAVPALKPGESTEVVLEFTSPPYVGAYFNTWKLITSKRTYFGEAINFYVNVHECGMVDLAQQFHQLST